MKIIAKNFLSWENLELEIPQGINIIEGFNHDDQTSEGSGKSALINAICWAIYGKLPKDVNIDEIIKEGYKGCEVLLNLDDGSSIKRTRNPNNIEFIHFKKGLQQGKDARETQKIIEEFIGISFDTFCQTIYFAQNYPKKFIFSNREEKGKVISELQNLNQFDKAIKKAKEYIKDLKPKIIENETLLEVTKSRIRSQQIAIEDAEKLILDFNEEKTNKLNNLKEQIETEAPKLKEIYKLLKLKKEEIQSFDAQKFIEQEKQGSLKIDSLDEKINSLKDKKLEAEKRVFQHKMLKDNKKSLEIRIFKLEDTPSFEDYYKECQRQIKHLDQNINTKEREIKEIKESKNHCPTCKQSWDSGDSEKAKKIEFLNREIKGFKNQIESIKKEVSIRREQNFKDSEELKEYKEKLIELTLKINEEQEQQDQKILKTFNSNIEKIQDKKAQLKEKVKEIQQSIKSIELKKSEFKAQVQLIEQRKQALKEKKKEYELEEKREPSKLKENLDKYNETLIELRLDFKKQQKENTLLSKELTELNILKDGYRDVKVLVFQNVLQELNRLTNEYLSQLFEIPISLKFVNNNMQIDLEINFDGNPRSLGLFSGGQTRRIMLAVDLALAKIIQGRGANKLNLLFFDEVCKDLSENSMSKILDLLKKINMNILLIEHNSIFKSIVDNTIKIGLKEGTSFLE